MVRRLRHRLPWLLLGLIGAMASALLVGAFGVLLVAAGLGGMMRRRRDSAGQPAR